MGESEGGEREKESGGGPWLTGGLEGALLVSGRFQAVFLKNVLQFGFPGSLFDGATILDE